MFNFLLVDSNSAKEFQKIVDDAFHAEDKRVASWCRVSQGNSPCLVAQLGSVSIAVEGGANLGKCYYKSQVRRVPSV